MKRKSRTASAAPIASALFLAGSVCVGCNNGGGNSNNPFDAGTPSVHNTNQQPMLMCTIGSSADRAMSMVLSSDRRLDTFPDAFVEGDTLQVDCSATTDDTSTLQDIIFEIATDYDPETPQFIGLSDPVFDWPNVTPGRLKMALRATDKEGASTVKAFTRVVRCREGSQPTIGDGTFSVVPGDAFNEYDFTFDESKLGNGKEFWYAVDFDGNGTMESWHDGNILGVYVPFFGTRNLAVKVANECQFESIAVVPIDFARTNVDDGAQAHLMGYDYVEGVLSMDGESTNPQRFNAKFIITTDKVHLTNVETTPIQSQYGMKRLKKGALRFDADVKWGVDGRSLTLGFNISKIPDFGYKRNVFEDLRMEDFVITLHGEGDGVSPDTFKGNCLIERLVVERAKALDYCDEGMRRHCDFSGETETQTYFDFECSALESETTGRTLRLTQGKAFETTGAGSCSCIKQVVTSGGSSSGGGGAGGGAQ